MDSSRMDALLRNGVLLQLGCVFYSTSHSTSVASTTSISTSNRSSNSISIIRFPIIAQGFFGFEVHILLQWGGRGSGGGGRTMGGVGGGVGG